MGKFRMPSAYTVLFLIILLMTALTWVIPSGAYDYGPDGEPIYHPVVILDDQGMGTSATLEISQARQ